jgi:8-oxo-dGDP phosphatase
VRRARQLLIVSAVRQIGTRVVYENARVRVRRDDVVFPGELPGDYTVIETADFALVVPLDGDGVWLVEQYRYPIGRRSWEFPQGTWPIEPTEPDRASHRETFPGGVRGELRELAEHELLEETGFRAGHLEPLGAFFTGCGYSAQRVHPFLATGLRPGRPRREATEAGMVLRRFALEDVRAMIAAGTIVDIYTVAAFGLVQSRLATVSTAAP